MGEREYQMETRTGVRFDLLHPKAADIRAEDVAHALAHICRYNGHVSEYYSVAEHCCLMADWALANDSELLARECLVHDAAEAYVGDIVRDTKALLHGYQDLEDAVQRVVREAWGIGEPPIAGLVKMVDNRILVDESHALYRSRGGGWKGIEGLEPLGVKVECWDPRKAKYEYRHRLRRLVPGAFTVVS